jgi:hypothetical protein
METVRQPVSFVGFVRSVWFVWLHERNQIDRTDQNTGQAGLVPAMYANQIPLG